MIKFKLLFFVILSFLFTFSATSAEQGYLHVNYGITTHSVGHTSKYSAPGGTSTTTVDEEDQGFMISGGALIGSNWGVDLMYYDLGESKIKGDADDIFELGGSQYQFSTGGTISNSTSGFGLGVIGFMSSESLISAFGKIGLHDWDRSGSTTLLTDNTNINSRFFDEGIDLYAGFGIDINVLESLSVNLSYDTLGFEDAASSFSKTSSLISLGLSAAF